MPKVKAKKKEENKGKISIEYSKEAPDYGTFKGAAAPAQTKKLETAMTSEQAKKKVKAAQNKEKEEFLMEKAEAEGISKANVDAQKRKEDEARKKMHQELVKVRAKAKGEK